MFTDAFPIFATPSVERALGFYRDLLDGKVTYQFPPEGDPGYVALAIGSTQIGLAQSPETSAGPGGQRISLWVYADDCDAAVDRLRAGGAVIVEEPADQPWGERVARVQDPDGNEILIGSNPDR
ncbi:MAG: VOC family protein [Acidimicrobiales bacterium]